MRKFVLALALLVSLSATAQIITPATSVAVSVLRLLIDLGSGRQEYVQIDVISEGNSLDQARSEGFRTAIGQAIGTVVATQTESQKQRLVRDEIINYSSGFVDRYEILERNEIGNRIRIKMRVWVAETKLAQRLLSKGFSTQMVPGDQLSAQAQTLLEERQQGDRLIATIMRDYPHRAFDVIVDRGRMRVTNTRSVMIEVPVEVKWNPNFVAALREALARTNDPVKPGLAYNMAVMSNPAIEISAVDAGGAIIAKTCQMFTVSPESAGYHRPTRYLLSMRGDQIWINDRYSVAGIFALGFPQNPNLVQNINQIRVEIVSGTKC